MQLPFSEAHSAPAIKPHDTHNTSTTTAHHLSSTTADGNADIAVIADPLTTQSIVEAALDKTEPIEVVKQTIDTLEAQGLLMLFDRHDQVAKRLTGDLIAAGVLHEVQPSQQKAPTNG